MKRSGNIDMAGKKVIVAGLARSGIEAACLLLKMGAEVYVTDLRREEELEQLNKLNGRAVICAGGHDKVPVSGMDLAVISPGIPWNSPFLKRLRSCGISLVSELEFSALFVDVPLIAVTGTNGKTTTAMLISEILKAGGKGVFTGGNIGTPLAEYLLSGERADYVVCEVSSFQLEGVRAFRPDVSVILNISEDHLDRHENMREYASLKERVFMNQGSGDTLILNAADPYLRDLAIPGGVSVRRFSSRKGAADNSAWIDGNALCLSEKGETKIVCCVGDIPLSGGHNLENVMAAVLAARVFEIDHADIFTGIKKFSSVDHRMEEVGSAGGITFINDSKGTNVSAAEKAVKSFDGPVILIAGGKDKGGDYTPLVNAIRERVKHVVLVGEAEARISSLLGGYDRKSAAASIDEAVIKAVAEASSGDVVLLSPACSSFDMFRSYEERGEVFRSAVSRLEGFTSGSEGRDA